MEEGAVVIVQPVTSLPKKPFRPIVYSRRNASRMTHLELAMKYAEERKAKLERERLQQVQLRQHTIIVKNESKGRFTVYMIISMC